MTQLIDALERMGQDSSLQHADRAQLDSRLAAMGIEDDARAVLLDGHPTQLENLLGASPNTCCLIVTADD